MAVITTGNHPAALWPGIAKWWGRKYDEHATEWTDLFDSETSEKAYERDALVTGFGLAPEKPQGTAVSYDTETQGFLTTYTHVAYALGYIVTHEELMDNLYTEVSKRRAGALAFSMRQTKEIVHANVLNTGFATFTTGDAAYLFSASHTGSGGAWSNLLYPAADLSVDSIKDLCIQIYGAKNDRGHNINLIPQSLHVPPGLWFEANTIMKSVLQSGTAENDVNVLKALGVFPKGIKMNHYFTDSDAWFIRTNAPRGMMSFQREAVSFTQDNDFDTMNAKAKCYERYVPGCTDPRGIYGSAGA
jgi:hypothetical protein